MASQNFLNPESQPAVALMTSVIRLLATPAERRYCLHYRQIACQSFHCSLRIERDDKSFLENGFLKSFLQKQAEILGELDL